MSLHKSRAVCVYVLSPFVVSCTVLHWCVELRPSRSHPVFPVYVTTDSSLYCAFSALTLLVGRQEGHPACKNFEWCSTGIVVYLERGADLHMAQLMSLPLTVSCFSKIQIGFTCLVPAHPGSPWKRAVKRVCVCVCRYTKFKSILEFLSSYH